jgi:hypothetical protein
MNRLEHKFVVYVDILGFSKLTLENELQIENIRDNEGPAFRKFEKIFQENRKDNDLTAIVFGTDIAFLCNTFKSAQADCLSVQHLQHYFKIMFF